MTREQQLIWAAGFFDGEGCVYVSRDSLYQRYRLGCTCTNTVRKPLKLMQKLFGGTYFLKESREGSKPCYLWSSGGQNAMAALEEMLPYLVVKRRQAEIAIAFQQRRITMPYKTDSRQRLDHQDYLDLRELKRGIGV